MRVCNALFRHDTRWLERGALRPPIDATPAQGEPPDSCHLLEEIREQHHVEPASNCSSVERNLTLERFPFALAHGTRSGNLVKDAFSQTG
jgi:hypothetical protein